MNSAIKFFFHSCLVYFLGILFWITTSLYILLTLPLYIYRWVIVKVAPRFAEEDIKKAVSLLSQIFLGDLLNSHNSKSRCGVVLGLIIDGHTTVEEFVETIKSKWFSVKGASQFPELQQYPENWMGIMFWKQDKKFKLENHLYLHELEESSSHLKCEEYRSKLVERLVNDSFTPQKSPWEMHMISNYKDLRLKAAADHDSLKESGKQTLLIFRMHHCMGDGFGLINMFVGTGNDNIDEVTKHLPKSSETISYFNNAKSLVMFSVQATYCAGYFLLAHTRPTSVYDIPDSKKSYHQLYASSPIIPVSKVKFIKNVFGVTFSSVIYSSFAAALGKLQSSLVKRDPNGGIPLLNNILIGHPVPMPNHPKTLSNYFSVIAFEAPINAGMSSLKRLKSCQQRDQEMTNAASVLVMNMMTKVLSGHLIPFTRFMTHNRCYSTLLSNFPLKEMNVFWNGIKVISIDGAVGACDGTAGVVLASVGYNGVVHITATAEAAVMCQDELNKLLMYTYEEINVLHEMAREYTKTLHN